VSNSAVRRAIHVSTAALVLVGGTVGWDDLKIWMTGLAVVAIAGEVMRIRFPGFRAFLARAVPAFRPEEAHRPSGALWLCLGYTAATWVPIPGPAAGVLVAAVADPVASAVGGRWGGGAAKSWIGTVAAMVVAALSLAALGLALPSVAAGAIAAAALERWSRPLDDNLVVAPGVALAVWMTG
jgi:dolichol kinase